MTEEVNQPDPIRVTSLATTNLQLIKGGKCNLSSLIASNNGAAVAFVKLYDKASAPVLASDVPVAVIAVPAGGNASISGPFMGQPFVLGLALAITNLVADTDATAVVAGQVKIMGAVAGR